jgi:prepilin-type N-terminal cleavage/methylation domain-containing protein
MKGSRMMHPRSQAGFTVLEVMTAVLIFSVGMLGVATMLTTSAKTDSYTADVRVADYLAQAKMEELRGKAPMLDIAYEKTDANPSPSAIPGSDNPSFYRKYTRKWTVYPVECTACDEVTNKGSCVGNSWCKYPVAHAEVIIGWPMDSRHPDCTNTQIMKCVHTVRLDGYILQRACAKCR